MYHQVCERTSDPWELAVSGENFDAQLKEIGKAFNVVPLEELATSVRQRKLKHKLLSITFDDGFRDNYTTAKPMLEADSLPATFFFTTNSFSEARTFWWEELEALILHAPELPRRISLMIGSIRFDFAFTRDARLNATLTRQIKAWSASDEPPNERTRLFMELWRVIKPLAFTEQLNVLDRLREITHVNVQSTPEVMTCDEMKQLRKNKLFSIGAHTVHHAMLGAQDKQTQQSEIVDSKRALEKMLSEDVTSFAYPYGNYNQTTTMLLREAGFHYAVSTKPGTVTHSDSVFELPRIQVKNWGKKTFLKELNQITRL